MIIDDLRPPVPYPQPWPPVRWYPPIEPYTIAGARSWWGAPYAVLRGWRELQLDAHVPTAATGPVPGVVWVHGGGFETGTRWRLPLQWPQRSLFDKLVAAGLAVVSVDYRHAAEDPDRLGCVRDVRAAVRYVRHYASELGIDPARLGIWGESAGGYLAAFTGLLGDRPGQAGGPDLLGDEGVMDESSAVQAVADWYGAHDYTTWPGEEEGAKLGFSPVDLRAASPIAYVTPDAPPFWIMHGLADRTIPFAQSEALHTALVEAGVASTLTTIPKADHVFMGADVPALMDSTVAWLAQTLGA